MWVRVRSYRLAGEAPASLVYIAGPSAVPLDGRARVSKWAPRAGAGLNQRATPLWCAVAVGALDGHRHRG